MNKKFKVLLLIPKFFWTAVAKILPDGRYKYIANKVRFIKFQKYLIKHFVEYLAKVKKNNRIMIINKGLENHNVFNMCFLQEMMSEIAYALQEGYIPYIDYKFEDEGVEKNLWEQYLLQPFELTQGELDEMEHRICVPNRYVIMQPDFRMVKDELDKNFWGILYRQFIIPNRNVDGYLQKCKEKMYGQGNNDLNLKRTLGVIVRGTDYITLKPKNHPIQPTVESVIDMVSKYQEKYEYIFVTSDEKRIVDLFAEKFPGKVVNFPKSYYDEKFYSNKDITHINQVKFQREGDVFKKGLEYFSSILIISKCSGLIGGNCGGMQAAVFLNNARNLEYVFELGLYE